MSSSPKVFVSNCLKTTPLCILFHCYIWDRPKYTQSATYIETDHQNLRLTNGRFMNISSQFFANYKNMFYQTEVQMVILVCWTSFNCKWFKSYDKKRKYFHFYFFAILYINRYFHLFCILRLCVFCHNLCTN